MPNCSPVNFEKLAIAIVTHNRPAIAQQTIDGALRSVPNYRACYLIGNHPLDESTIGQTFLAANDLRRRFISTGRIPEHTGRLAESWNLAMQWAFRDPEVEWLWCMHDDITIQPGWSEKVIARPAELYSAPFGDMCFLFSRHAFEEVGWFDERYTGIGYQDNDWITLATWKLGKDNVVSENECNIPKIGLTWIIHNPIGLKDYWQGREAMVDRKAVGFLWYERRWRNAWLDRRMDWIKAIKLGPAEPDFEWYPWFDRTREVAHVAT